MITSSSSASRVLLLANEMDALGCSEVMFNAKESIDIMEAMVLVGKKP